MNQTVTMSRTYAATPSAIWAAWADVAVLSRWWGCGVDMLWTVHDWEFREGGAIRVSQDFDGVPYEIQGRFVEVTEPTRLAFDWEKGQRITVTIAAAQEGTRMVVDHAGLPDGEHQDIVNGGWTAAFDQIDAVLPGAVT